ncbi:hypothetical protein AB2M62_02990 [Sphingomonas sp. MMS12-HWE2-04]
MRDYDPLPTPEEPDREHLEELIDEGEEESFPASDPPENPNFD